MQMYYMLYIICYTLHIMYYISYTVYYILHMHICIYLHTYAHIYWQSEKNTKYEFRWTWVQF